MKHLPNILSSLRIVGAVALLLTTASSIPFWALTSLAASATSPTDGWLGS